MLDDVGACQNPLASPSMEEARRRGAGALGDEPVAMSG
jgi:hypothetical protein